MSDMKSPFYDSILPIKTVFLSHMKTLHATLTCYSYFLQTSEGVRTSRLFSYRNSALLSLLLLLFVFQYFFALRFILFPIFIPPVTKVGGIKICPCLSVCLSVRPSVRSSRFTVQSLCNQLLLQFSVDLFETLHICCGHIEDVHVGFWWS